MTSNYITQSFSLEGKTAIVTGGTGGLGSAMTVALARAGADIASIELPNDAASQALKDKIEGVGRKIQVFNCDLRVPKCLRSCYQSIWEAGVVPDILLNCAGIIHRNLCENATDEELDLHIDVNIKAVYISTQEFGRKLISLNRPGKVINIASVTSYQSGFNTGIYASTKGAVLQMTKAFSNEWSSKGIQVNCIAPGFMKTTITVQYQQNQEMTKYLMSRVPMGRWGEPEDLESAVLFLSAPASKFVTGICLPVDGGFLGK